MKTCNFLKHRFLCAKSEKHKVLFLTTLLAFILLITPAITKSQNVEDLLIQNNISEIIEKQWTENDGLSSSAIRKIGQTKEGYLLIATYHGISLFDGNQFRNYTTQNLPILESNYVIDFCADTSGGFFVATQKKVISYNKGFYKTKFYNQLKNTKIQCINIDKDGVLWIGLVNGLYKVINGELSKATEIDSIQNKPITLIYTDNSGNTWFGTSKGVLYKYNKNNVKHMYCCENAHEFTSAIEDNKGNMYFGSTNGLYKCKNDSFELINSDIAPINNLTLDNKKRVWVGSSSGLYFYDNTKEQLVKVKTKANIAQIQAIYFDNDKNLWLGSYRNGIMQLRRGVFTNIPMDISIINDTPTTTSQLGDSVFIVGSSQGNIYRIVNGKYQKVEIKTDLGQKEIKRIFVDSKKNMWICSYAGLLKISPSKKEKLLNTETGFPDNSVRDIAEMKNGNYLIGTKSGLFLINEDLEIIKEIKNRQKTKDKGKKQLDSDFVMSMSRGLDSSILVSTKLGFYIIKDDKITKHYNEGENGLALNVVFNVIQDKDGIYWAATAEGLYIVKDEKIYKLNTIKELTENPIFDVVEDNIKYMWLLSKNNIYRIKKSQILNNINEDSTQINIEIFNKYDGMLDLYVNATKVLKTSKGHIVINTKSGISILNTNIIKVIKSAPNIIINGIKTEDKTYSDVKIRQKIQADSKYIKIDYSYIDFINSQKVEISYQLLPFDSKERRAKLGDPIIYTNLPPGNYTFYITAHVNTESSTSLKNFVPFTLLTPWYNTLFFKLSFIISLPIIVFFIYNLRLRRITRQKIELEKIISARTAEIKEQKEAIEITNENLKQKTDELEEVNSIKDKMFSIIGHDLRNPIGTTKSLLDVIVSNEEMNVEHSKKLMKTIQQSMGATYQLLENLLLWSRSQRNILEYTPTTFKINDVVDDIILSQQVSAKSKKIEIKKEFEADYNVHADRNMVSTIIRNLLSNAIKFTYEGGDILIKGEKDREEPNSLYISIIDSGVGIEQDYIDNINKEKSMFLSSQGTNKEQGSGLGIGICIEFLKKHNKKLIAKNNKIAGENDDGKSGSTFRFCLDIV